MSLYAFLLPYSFDRNIVDMMLSHIKKLYIPPRSSIVMYDILFLVTFLYCASNHIRRFQFRLTRDA